MPEFHAPTRIGYIGGRSGGDANIHAVPYPAGYKVGDLSIMMFYVMSATIRVNVPTGWTDVATVPGGSRTLQIMARTIAEADTVTGTRNFTLTAPSGVTWSSMVVRNAVAPAGLIAGPSWARASSTTTGTAPAVSVAQEGSLVLGLLAEQSTNTETEAQVVASGASKWFFQGHQTTIPHTHLVTYVDTAAVGTTSTINATYPHASNAASGIQLVVPGAEVVPDPAPSALFAGTFGFGPTWLTMGARIANPAGQVRVDATPVDGGVTVVSPTLSSPDAYGWASCRVAGLTPNVRYNLTMVDIGSGAALATVQATTTGGIRDDFKVLSTSCQKSNWNALAYADMAAEGAAFFSHQGDLHYQDATTEVAWRFGINSNLAQPAMKAFLATTPMTYRWDNHDWGGNSSWRESPPKNFAPQAIRQLMGAETFVDETGIYRTWTHNGVRFIDTDQWTLRDEADTTPNTNWEPGKTMWGVEQREWFFNTLLAATEPLIVWFTSFPLYGNYVANGRWGNFRDEATIIESWFGAHPEVHERIVGVGGDSHNIRADDGANTMWGLPSLNASPAGREGDTDGTEMSSTWWNICHLPASGVPGGTVQHGVYSLLEFDWNEDRTEVTFTWKAKRTGGEVAATWSKTFTDSISGGATAGVTRLVGGSEQPVGLSVFTGGAERAVTSFEIL